jgi:hypothetical protein
MTAAMTAAAAAAAAVVVCSSCTPNGDRWRCSSTTSSTSACSSSQVTSRHAAPVTISYSVVLEVINHQTCYECDCSADAVWPTRTL